MFVKGLVFIDINIRILLYSISIGLSLVLMGYFLLKSSKTKLLLSYMWLQSLVLTWSVHSLLLDIIRYSKLSYLYYQKTIVLFLYYMGYYNACFIGLGWLIFCLIYAKSRQLKNKLLLGALFLPPLVLFFTTIRKFIIPNLRDFSLYDMSLLAIQYVYCMIGTIVLLRFSIRQLGHMRQQSILIMIASIIPIAVRFIQDYKLFILRAGRIIYNFDPTPTGFSIGMLIIAVATFKYRFLDIVPFAMQKLVDNLNQAVVVIGVSNEVLALNKMLFDFFPFCENFKNGDNIEVLVKTLEKYIKSPQQSGRMINAIRSGVIVNIQGELVIGQPYEKYYSVTVQPFYSKREKLLGRIMTLTDITEYRELMSELQGKNEELLAMNQELTSMNEQLSEYASTVKELTLTKERNRFAREVHDTMGHTMTVLITLLKVSSITCETNSADTKEKIEEALSIAKAGLKELRRSIAGLNPERLEIDDFLGALRGLAAEFEAAGISVDLTADGFEGYDDPGYTGSLFRVCEEAMTNALRHGKAQNITMILKKTQDHIKLFITDDGCGCSHINKGYGLCGMEQRIRELDGQIEYGSDGENGFNIYVDIPLKNESKEQSIVEASDQ